ncbi:MAG: LuxR C-terminal-related transcriptional regulator [Anaerolineales bacterium]
MEQLLRTKLFIPPVRSELVSRPNLIGRLNDGLHRKLTLVSAPAGFGKTTLVIAWLESLRGNVKKDTQTKNRIAWLSLDENDNTYARFLTYFISALYQPEGVTTMIGDEALNLLQSSQPPPVETILTSLINEIAELPGKIIFILDDYHLIEAQSIHDALSFLLENLPPQLHLVIATREDPLLPLSRLRARGQLTELRAADLRFTYSEVAEFLNQVMGLNLTEDDIRALETRTEGWIAGLQLAAISLQGQKDTTNLIKTFTGSHRFILDYLIEEVLAQQPEHIQTFLLQTSILNRLTGSLCDAITGQGNGRMILEMLEHTNLFIIPLDNDRKWYRYHQLFADLLRQRLDQVDSERVPELHQLASEWYEQQKLWPDAIRHAFASEDLERTADLIELAWVPMNTSYRSVTWLSWAKKLPEEFIRAKPVLSTSCGWASLDAGDLEAAEHCFRDAESWLNTTISENEQHKAASGEKVVLDDEEFRSLSISIANGRAYLAQALGDMSITIKYAQWANELLHEDEYFERGLTDILLGFAYWAGGDLNTAHKAVTDAIANMHMAEKTPFIISFTSYLADIMTSQGRLLETERIYLQLLETLTKQGESELKEAAVLHFGLSELCFEMGDMEAAIQHLRRSDELGKRPAFPPWYRHWIWAHARVMAAQGDLEGIIEMLVGAERLYYRHPIPDVRPLKALLARVWLAQGNLTEALRWVHERNLSVDDDLNYLREFEHLTLTRVLLTQYENEGTEETIRKTIGFLERLLKAAEDGGRLGSSIEILALQALAFQAQNEVPHALASLKRALTLAEPAGYFRIFVDGGPPMARLLYEALSQEISPDYIRRLLEAFPVVEPETIDASSKQSHERDLIEPLSDREREILQLIAEGLTNQEIGSQLYLSLNTVKAHTRNIYGKLGVNSRTQATARARALGLLSSP